MIGCFKQCIWVIGCLKQCIKTGRSGQIALHFFSHPALLHLNDLSVPGPSRTYCERGNRRSRMSSPRRSSNTSNSQPLTVSSRPPPSPQPVISVTASICLFISRNVWLPSGRIALCRPAHRPRLHGSTS